MDTVLDMTRVSADVRLRPCHWECIACDLNVLAIQRIFAAGLALQSTAGIAEDPQITRRLENIIDELGAAISDIRTTIFGIEG